MSRSVSAVSMARSEYCRCPPRLPTPTASQVAIASGANHTVISPRWTSARSYAGQFPTWYFVLYFGCTLDFMSRSCTCRRYDGQEVDRGAPRARDRRVAPGDCSPEALTRTGLGGFHHPALPLMWLMAMRPRFARESEARAEDIVPTTQRTSARGPRPFECLVT